jgi:hypothetical protein
MTASLRLLVASVFTITLVACGAAPTEVTSDGGAVRAASAAAPSQEAPATTAPAAKTTPLSDLSVIGASDPVITGSLKMNGTVYEDSVYVRRCGGEATIFYDLNRSYTKLATVVGIDDGSLDPEEPEFEEVQQDKSAITVVVKADGAVKATVSPKLGAPAPLEVDLTNVLRLRIDITGGFLCWPAGGIATVVGLGDAKLTPKS